MSLSAAEKTALQASVQTLSDQVNALVIDPDVNPLQAALDAALADAAAKQVALTAALDDAAAKQAKIDAAKAAIQQAKTADAAEDAAQDAAFAALG